ncbi:hypothetical protein J3R30DRAFT_3687109 [Lentinula aciculospora]|uniref:Uncharacterized protein n=1 Tax=Lentinula aciculospora TaxID=153920 RepID=A0A9W9A021_9AGAR|nr:hypothetical protein J3R30DRAFT_3687109 [Lentinula aciculospora]
MYIFARRKKAPVWATSGVFLMVPLECVEMYLMVLKRGEKKTLGANDFISLAGAFTEDGKLNAGLSIMLCVKQIPKYTILPGKSVSPIAVFVLNWYERIREDRNEDHREE